MTNSVVANIYDNTRLQTQAVEQAMSGTWRSMNIKEGWLDSKGIPTPHDGGVIYQDNEMAFVAYVADEGAVPYAHAGPVMRKLADLFGYKKTANCKAMILECTDNDLITARIENGEQVLNMTPYGWETLKRWEWFRENDV